MRNKDKILVGDTLRIRSGDREEFCEIVEKRSPVVEGRVTVQTWERGKRRAYRQGKNILTLTGREFFLEKAVLAAFSPRTKFRDDCLAYFGIGAGRQEEVADVSSLVAPAPYVSGQFLAPVQAPALFPAATTTRTVAQLRRQYSRSEVSLGGETLALTEAGVFSDGDPLDNWAVGARPTDFSTTSGEAPFFYKTFEPVPNNAETTLLIEWEFRFL